MNVPQALLIYVLKRVEEKLDMPEVAFLEGYRYAEKLTTSAI